MATNLYVGNLPWTTTNEELHTMFAQYGQVVKAQIVTDRDTGRSRGFGFVEMANEAEAQAAIDALHEFQMNGRPLTVNIATMVVDLHVNDEFALTEQVAFPAGVQDLLVAIGPNYLEAHANLFSVDYDAFRVDLQ